MKKFIAIILMLMMVCTVFVACGSNDGANEDPNRVAAGSMEEDEEDEETTLSASSVKDIAVAKWVGTNSNTGTNIEIELSADGTYKAAFADKYGNSKKYSGKYTLSTKDKKPRDDDFDQDDKYDIESYYDYEFDYSIKFDGDMQVEYHLINDKTLGFWDDDELFFLIRS